MPFEIDIVALLQSSVINVISGLITNLFWIILFIWGIKTIVKQVPHWINSYWEQRQKQLKIEWARGIQNGK